MNGGSDVLPGSLLFSQGGHNRQKVFGFSLSTRKKYYLKSVWLSKVEASVFKTGEFKDFPNVGLLFTNTLCRDHGLLRPQPYVLTTIRSRLTVWILSEFSFSIRKNLHQSICFFLK